MSTKKTWAVFEIGHSANMLAEVQASTEKQAVDLASSYHGIPRKKLYAVPGGVLSRIPEAPGLNRGPARTHSTKKSQIRARAKSDESRVLTAAPHIAEIHRTQYLYEEPTALIAAVHAAQKHLAAMKRLSRKLTPKHPGGAIDSSGASDQGAYDLANLLVEVKPRLAYMRKQLRQKPAPRPAPPLTPKRHGTGRKLDYSVFARTGAQDCGNTLELQDHRDAWLELGKPRGAEAARKVVREVWGDDEEAYDRWRRQAAVDEIEEDGLDIRHAYKAWRDAWQGCAERAVKSAMKDWVAEYEGLGH